MTFDFSAAIQAATESVGVEAFRLFARVLINGPPHGFLASQDWLETPLSRAPSDAESGQAVFIAAIIMLESRRSLARLIVNDEFRAALTGNIVKAWIKKQGRKRANDHSAVFEAAVAGEPDASTKEIIRKLTNAGELEDVSATHYKLTKSGKKIAKASMDSKVSRVRKKLPTT